MMNKQLTDIEMIDKYLKGNCNDSEKETVKVRLVTDEDFRNLFDDVELMVEGLNATAVQTTKEEKLNRLRNFFQEANLASNNLLQDETGSLDDDEISESTLDSGLGKGKVIRFPVAAMINQYKIAIAAAVTLLIAAWFVVYNMNPLTDEQLFDRYFKPFENVGGGERGASSKQPPAYNAYDRGDYESAVTQFEKSVEPNDISMDVFYLGNAYLKTGQTEKAIDIFNRFIESGSGLTLFAKWYLGLCYVRTGQRDLARKMFMDVSQADEDEYAKKATKILRQLK